MITERQSLSPPWSDIHSLIAEIKDLIASNNALAAAVSSLATGGVPLTPASINVLNANLQSLIQAINGMSSGGGGQIDVSGIISRLDTLIAMGTNAAKVQMWSIQVATVNKELALPNWTIPDGFSVSVTNRFGNPLASLLTIYTVEDATQIKILPVGASWSWRISNLQDLKISGDTLTMWVDLDSEKK
jgi:hypothetical protein